MNIKDMLLVSGLPASGKSTLCNKISEKTGYKRLGTDDIRQEFFTDETPSEHKYSKPSLALVYEILYLRCELKMFNAESGLIIDGMHFHPPGWERSSKIAERHGYEMYFIQLIAEYNVLKKRIENRINDVYNSEADSSVLYMYWEKLEKGEMNYATRTESFKKLNFKWFEIDASSYEIINCNSDKPLWLNL